MMPIDSPTAIDGARVLVIERVFQAPRAVVFSAWSRVEHLVQWFGPKNFTLPFCEVDFRIGGSYRFCMLSPEGEEHWVWGEYREIVEPERLVFTWNRENSDGQIWSSTVVELGFAEHDGETAFTLRQSSFETTAYRDEHGFGWGQALDRLASFVQGVEKS